MLRSRKFWIGQIQSQKFWKVGVGDFTSDSATLAIVTAQVLLILLYVRVAE